MQDSSTSQPAVQSHICKDIGMNSSATRSTIQGTSSPSLHDTSSTREQDQRGTGTGQGKVKVETETGEEGKMEVEEVGMRCNTISAESMAMAVNSVDVSIGVPKTCTADLSITSDMTAAASIWKYCNSSSAFCSSASVGSGAGENPPSLIKLGRDLY